MQLAPQQTLKLLPRGLGGSVGFSTTSARSTACNPKSRFIVFLLGQNWPDTQRLGEYCFAALRFSDELELPIEQIPVVILAVRDHDNSLAASIMQNCPHYLVASFDVDVRQRFVKNIKICIL